MPTTNVLSKPAPPAAPARLEVANVAVAYDGIPVLSGITFHVPQGGRTAVVGPNGAGKSTLFKALVGLLPLRAGSIRIHGRPLGDHKDCVAYVPQRGEIDWRFPLSVEDLVMMGRIRRLGWLRQPGGSDRGVVAGCLEQLGLTDLAHKTIGELSGGQQQRAFLARALAQEPHILLLDEPFTGVDPGTQEATLDLLDRLGASGVTVLASTHDLNLAASRFDQIVLLNRTLIAVGLPSQVLTPAAIRQAFGERVLMLEGGALVDECCPPDEPMM
ncbi:MAG TPA: metal ABC transporter ATP-binding protein [Anaerolineales bacterium]|nr:metal ABC transporter ATP-binding protein [Anaerolineales bacterium]